MGRPILSSGITAVLCPDPQAREAFALQACGGGEGLPLFAPGEQRLLVSAKQALALIEVQEGLDDSDYTDGAVYQGVAIGEFISSFGEADGEALEGMRLFPLLDRGVRFLSNGEMRKALSLAALASSASLLVFDDPYDGLDKDSRKTLERAFITARKANPLLSLLLLVEHENDLPDFADLSLVLCPCGPRPASHEDAIAYLRSLAGGAHGWRFPESARAGSGAQNAPSKREALIEMRAVKLAYDGRPIFSLKQWRVEEGEHWLIRGPNGCGKSSLLGMISGDNVKAYGQDLRIFGARKGSGESVWDLKRDIGAVSREFHLRYRVNLSLLDTVVSGCFDSIGLYEEPTRSQRERARELCAAAGWEPEAWSRGFVESPYAVQRLALILRALIKEPRLLILDEPCQGLDDAHRAAFLESLSVLVSSSRVTSLYVTHREEEIPSYITDILEFEASGGSFVCGAWKA